MNCKHIFAAAAVAAFAMAGAAQADVVDFNSAPADTWYYGGGNDYSPANTIVLTTSDGDQLYLRAHETFEVAPASSGDTYSFATGLSAISFDWGFDSSTGSPGDLSALITVTNFAGGSFSYDPFVLTPDNELLNGSVQNSARLNWWPIGFDPNVDGSYGVELAVDGLKGGAKSLSIRIDVGQGFQGAVPEPASWALMILGFGGAGAALRRRRGQALTA